MLNKQTTKCTECEGSGIHSTPHIATDMFVNSACNTCSGTGIETQSEEVTNQLIEILS